MSSFHSIAVQWFISGIHESYCIDLFTILVIQHVHTVYAFPPSITSYSPPTTCFRTHAQTHIYVSVLLSTCHTLAVYVLTIHSLTSSPLFASYSPTFLHQTTPTPYAFIPTSSVSPFSAPPLLPIPCTYPFPPTLSYATTSTLSPCGCGCQSAYSC